MKTRANTMGGALVVPMRSVAVLQAVPTGSLAVPVRSPRVARGQRAARTRYRTNY